MRKHSIGSRLLSLLLAVVMVIGMVPAMQLGASAAIVSGGHGMGLTSSDKITMPIKIMDYTSDGMLFDFTSGRSSMNTASAYKPETNYWADFTGTLTSGTLLNSASRNVRYGTGFDTVSLASTPGSYNGAQWINVAKSSLGGKQLLTVTNVKESSTGVPTQWQIADFTSAPTSMTNIRYMSLVYRAYDYDVSDPKIGVSTVLSETTSSRYATGKFSGWYHINTSGGINQAGDRNVDSAVIDLKNITAGSWDKLYLDFPMNTKPDASGNLTGDQRFDIVAVAFFRYEGDAHQFNHWASTLGCMSDTDAWTSSTSGKSGNIPLDSYDNNNTGFSMFTGYDNTFAGNNNIIKWLAGSSNGTPRIEAGQQPLTISGTANLSGTTKFPVWSTSGTGTFDWAGSGVTGVTAEQATGVKLFQTVGKTQAKGYVTIGLMEPSLDENGYPAYKKGAMLFVMTYLRNCLINAYEYELDGWRNYSTITGEPNGAIFGYMNGGQVDHDPNTAGIQGIPMDFATALSKQLNVDRRTLSADNGTQKTGTTGSYEATMKKRAYLQGAWLDCKQYVTTWWDAAYYMLNNLFVPNSYNELQSEYNYLNLYKSTNTSSTSYGHYVFDSSLTTTSASPYTTAVTYNTDTKTIGHAGASYKTSFNSAEAYNPFTPVNYGKGDAGESNKMYYLDDGVNVYSGFGGNLWYEDKNYGFSLACNGMFTYKSGSNLMFNFDGDDDVYLFINGELVLDMGGTHNNTNSVMYLNEYVNWAKDVLKNRSNYTLEQIARAEKLNLVDGQDYSFDFYYMERQGTGANLRIETNINVVVPELDVEKVASQNGVEVPDNGVVDNKAPVEYGFSLTNDGDTSKLYNIGFTDSEIGVTLSPEKGLEVKYYNLTKDKNGGTLEANDLVAYVDGYDGDPRRPGTKKLKTIEVTFEDNEDLKQFLTNLTSDDGTDTTVSDGLYSGDGLWAFATVTVRGFYYTQTKTEQAQASFTNPVTATAYNGAYKLTGTDTHTVFAFGEPAYFMWADHKITLDAEKLYEDLKNSATYSKFDIPEPGHMDLTLSDSTGNPMEYEYVDNSVGGDVYLTVDYPDPGMHVFYLHVGDKTDPNNEFVVSVVIYALSAKDSAVVLDYGLTADLSTGNGMFNGDFYKISSKETLNKVMAITGVSAKPEYIEQNVDGLHSAINTENNITALSDDTTAYIGKFDTPVYLRHDLPWVIEWKTTGTHSGGLMFTLNTTGNTAGNVYVYTRNYTNGKESAGNNADFIALGRWHNGSYDNHGIDLTSKGYNMNVGQTYRLQNRPYTDGSNQVVMFINDKEVGVLDTYWVGTTKQSSASTFISGTDFTFTGMGTTGHPVDLTNLEYVNIYEDGRELNNYRWEATSNSDVHGVTTGEPGNVLNNNAWGLGGSASDTDGYYGKLNEPVQLNHDKEWAVEFQLSGLELKGEGSEKDGANEEAMILVSTGTTEREYIYVRADSGLVAVGTTDAVGHHNFGIGLKDVIPGFSTKDKHTYRIENRINTDGTCMAYLIVDGDEIGPMTQEYSSGQILHGVTGDIFTGNNLMFTHIGHKDGHWAVDCVIHYLQVWEDTSLTGTYGWVKDNTGLLVDNSVTDVNGNRINFVGDATHGVIDGDKTEGSIDAADGIFNFSDNKLTFTPDKFLGDNDNSIKVALTVYDRDSNPTPLSEQRVDIANEVQMFKNIKVIPATVVYYEDDFVKVNYLNQSADGFHVIGSGSSGLIQGSDFDENYGSDDAYDDATQIYGGNSLHQVPIEKGPIAYFTFQGTGFEIIASTNAVDSGSLYIKVFEHDANANVTVQQNGTANGNVSAGTQVGMIPVITEYDYYDDEGSEALYQVPIISWDSGSDTAKTYTAIIYGVPNYKYNDDGTKTMLEKYLYLDGIRIYQPLGATNEGYTPVENSATFVKLSQLITDGIITAADYYGDGTSFGAGLNVWTENHIQAEMKGHKVDAVSDYLTMGPNNEVYMDGSFTRSALIMLIKEDSSAVHDLQVAISAIDYGMFIGAGHTYPSVKVMYGSYNPDGTNISDKYGWKELTTISSGTEQYYTIPYKSCPVVQGYYMVALQVTPTDPTIPALASFSNLKYNGMELASYTAAMTTGIGEVSAEELVGDMSYMMGSMILLENEAEPGIDFVKPDFDDTTDAPVVAPKYPSLSFEDEIRYNVYFTAENLGELTGADMGLITFDSNMANGTIANATDVFPGATANGSYYVVSTDGISAKNLGDTLYFKVYVKQADGTYIYSDLYSYSAVEYAKDRLANSNSESLKALVVAMLNYGAEAQNYFGYKTDALMNDFLTAEQKAMVASYDANMGHATGNVSTAKQGIFAKTETGFGLKYPSVDFGGAFSINYFFKANAQVDGDVSFYYWTAEDYANADVLTAENASGKMTMVDTGNGLYKATVADIAAKEINSAVYVAAVYESNGVTCASGVLPYSLGAYCADRVANGSAAMQSFASATAVYGYYAENYFAD